LERLLLADPEFSLASSTRELSEARDAGTDVVLAQVDGAIPEEAFEFGDEAALVLLVPHAQLENAALLLRQGVRGVLSSDSGGELQVLQMMSEGLSNKQIASRLHISDHTAKFHVASIIGKLGAASRTDAVARGIRQGILTL
jgi:DNA-binding CsgD family transcriptional regulator